MLAILSQRLSDELVYKCAPMIRYSLKCENDHSFDSWFASVEAFEKLHAAGMVACAVCGSAHVQKALMTPSVRSARKFAAGHEPEPDQAANGASAPTKSENAAHPLSKPQNAAEELFDAMRRTVEENSDYVGGDFAAEARAMHAGEKPERSIHGEAPLSEAKALLEEGIPVTPLPILSKRKRN
ncbi:hypothetical protein SAMN05877809_101607 [Rhodobacter sp. JA431]|nr:hypothetical protein SAMN05877809_101607 [Rhodobacter sp. JA431]